ncbi:MAG: Sec-independent protein translocase subunit TatA/TatB [Thermomicrobiales bacterium]
MNFFGMGAWEIGVILIAALIIFGPGKLPEVAGQVGRAVRDFRRMTTDLTAEFEQTAGVKELRDEIAGIRSELTGATDGVKREMSSAAKSVNRSVSSAKTAAGGKKTTSTSAKSTTTAAKTTTTTAAKSSATASKSTTKSAAAKSKPVASKADPLADVSFLDDADSSRAASSGNGRDIEAQAAFDSIGAIGDAAAMTADGQEDALARARRRRQQAGYGRPRS